jgi:type II secretory pathway pseudopilin PulG
MSAGRRQQGFTYVAILIFVALAGAGLAAFGEFASHASQREKEAELLFVGNQYRQAIASYFRKERSYPKTLAELLEDRRYPMPVRHLRKLYRDPVTGSAAWGLIEAPGGAGIMGVHSLSETAAIKTGNFAARDAALMEARNPEAPEVRYKDWKFFYTPPSPSGPPPSQRAS